MSDVWIDGYDPQVPSPALQLILEALYLVRSREIINPNLGAIRVLLTAARVSASQLNLIGAASLGIPEMACIARMFTKRMHESRAGLELQMKRWSAEAKHL